jgi:hypothetical protein
MSTDAALTAFHNAVSQVLTTVSVSDPVTIYSDTHVINLDRPAKSTLPTSSDRSTSSGHDAGENKSKIHQTLATVENVTVVNTEEGPITCRRICSGPPDQMTCAMECSPNLMRKKPHPKEAKQATLNPPPLSPSSHASATDSLDSDKRHDILMEATRLYIAHVAKIFQWPRMHEYEHLLFCMARYINGLSPLTLPMGADLEHLYILHRCEHDVGTRHTSSFHDCTLAKYAKVMPSNQDAPREVSLLIRDFVAQPNKYEMILDPQQFMERLQLVPTPILSRFAQCAWRHPDGPDAKKSPLHVHCRGRNNPLVIRESHIMQGEALIIPIGVHMEHQAQPDTTKFPSDTSTVSDSDAGAAGAAETMCDFEYNIVSMEEEYEENAFKKQQQQQ